MECSVKLLELLELFGGGKDKKYEEKLKFQIGIGKKPLKW